MLGATDDRPKSLSPLNIFEKANLKNLSNATKGGKAE
jgi:hypothetical protein